MAAADTGAAAEAASGITYVACYLVIRHDLDRYEYKFTRYPTAEAAADHLIFQGQTKSDKGYLVTANAAAARRYLCAGLDGEGAGNMIWIPEWERRSNGDRMHIIATRRPERYSKAVQATLNNELQNLGMKVDSYKMGRWIDDLP